MNLRKNISRIISCTAAAVILGTTSVKFKKRGNKMNTWRKTVINMTALRDEYIKKRTSEPISVHRTLILRGLALLYEQIQEAKEFFEPIKPLLIENVTLPDRSGDYEKGAGRHYYCAANFIFFLR